MIGGVADTHAALWCLYDDGRLSIAAGEFIDRSAAAGNQIVVSSISLAEIVYLIEKNRLPGRGVQKFEGRARRPGLRVQSPRRRCFRRDTQRGTAIGPGGSRDRIGEATSPARSIRLAYYDRRRGA